MPIGPDPGIRAAQQVAQQNMLAQQQRSRMNTAYPQQHAGIAGCFQTLIFLIVLSGIILAILWFMTPLFK